MAGDVSAGRPVKGSPVVPGVPGPFTAGDLWGTIWRISWPMLIIMILNFLVGFTDIFVAGLIDSKVQAAIGFISQLYFLLIIVGNAISVGTVALVSRSIGAGDFEQALDNARQSLIFSLAVAAVLTAGGLAFHQWIVLYAGFPDDIRRIAETFLILYAFALGPNYVLIVSNGIFRASGEVKKPLVTMVIFSVLNIIGDFVLVFGIGPFPKMGYPGIALSTAISVAVAMAVNLGFFFFSDWRKLFVGLFKPVRRTIERIAKIGWPAGLLQVAWSAGSIVLYNILSRLGEQSIVAIASITNGLRLEAIIFLPAFAMNMAASVLVGQNLGAGNPERAAQIGWKIAQIAAIILSAMACVIFIRAESFASLLTRDPAVLAETARYLRVNMFSEPFMAYSLVLSGALQGAGDTRGSMWVIIICMWMIRLPLAFFLAVILGLGAMGVWTAMVTSMAFQGLLMAYRFRSGRWKGIRFA